MFSSRPFMCLLIYFFVQYVPSVEDTVIGVVVDTKPDVSVYLHSEVCESVLPPFLDICPRLPWYWPKKHQTKSKFKIAGSIGPWTILIKLHTQLHNQFYYRCKAGERGVILNQFLNGETLWNCSSPKYGQMLHGWCFYIWHHSEISSPISVKIIRWLPLHIYNM